MAKVTGVRAKMIMKIRVELHHWTENSGYNYSETFDNYETENVAENEAELYVKALDESFDLKANEAINVELYNEDDELISEYWVEKKLL